MARFARTLTTPRRTFVLLLGLLVCGTALGGIANAVDVDPTKPSASFTYTPASPSTGGTVTFRSTSTPGILGAEIVTEAWDLNNDGNFDDDTGSQVKSSFSTAGDYTVGLQVTDANGASDVATAVVTVQNRPPAASFSVSPSAPSTLQTVTFTSTSTDPDGTIASYAWDLDNDGNFNDGTDSAAQRSFTFAGTYTVRLLVTDNNGDSAVADETIDVGNQAPVASFDRSPASPLTGEQITLTSTSIDADGSITGYAWDLNGDNDFTDAGGAVAQVSFSTPGNHTVRLRVTDNDGAPATASQIVTVSNRGPTASFTTSPPAPATGEQITFTSTSTDPDDGIASYAWDLDNDNQFDDATGPTAHKSFPAAGSYGVSLQVTDDSGVTDTATGTVNVANRDPSASFTSSPLSPKTGDPVTFSSTSADPDGSIASLAWDLDNDGNFNDGAGNQAQRTFSLPGTYTVKLMAVDNDGASTVATGSVQIGNRDPTAAFSFSPEAPKTLEQITFSSGSADPDGSIAAYAWDLDNDGQFDDGTGSTAQTSFAAAGTHTVKLQVTDDHGATDVASLGVQVTNRAPTASFTYAPATPKTIEQVTFSSTSTDPDGSLSSYAWDLDNDGQFDDGTASQAVRSFAVAGTYTVKLKVTDSGGASTTTSGDVQIANRPPAAAFGFSPSSPKTTDPITLTSSSTDPDGAIASYSWDLDGDGTFGDSTASSPVTSFATPGQHTVQLRVTDNSGASDVASLPIDVANRPPTAGFGFAPLSPKTLEPVTFTSSSTDSDGTIAAYAWDLDNDGQFDDGTGAQAQRSFPVAATYTVKLKVTDSNGGTDTATKTVTAVNQAPMATFATSPAAPTTDGPVTFSSSSTDPEGLPLTTTWDLDNDGSFEASGATVERQFTAPGTYSFKLKVVDASGAQDLTSGTVTIPNRDPTVTVDHTPKNPQTRQAITFTATAADPEHRVKSLAWDSDNDGQFDDGTGTTLTRSFNKPGPYTVRFKIEDLDNASAIAEDIVAVNNQAPTASFVVLPESPVAGVSATLVSTALDPDTPLEKWLWDLNGDGVYGDAEGPQVQYTFPAVGSYTVGLRVLDSEDVDNFAVQTVVVQPPPIAAAAPQIAPSPGYTLLSPFPVVRLAGRIGRTGTRLRLFSIEAPPGARVVVRCSGHSCPFRLSARSAALPTDSGDGKVHTSASLRIRKLENRVLKKGVKISIYVTKSGTIGKFVQFKFRKRRPPSRVDRCLMPNDPSKPVQCPS